MSSCGLGDGDGLQPEARREGGREVLRIMPYEGVGVEVGSQPQSERSAAVDLRKVR